MNNANHAAKLVQLVALIAETVRESAEIPSGTIYATIMGTFSLGEYEWAIARLKGAKLIEETGSHLLRWVGPAVAS